MPKLILFVACEKVIIDHQQLPSLINIFQRMQIKLPDAPLPEKALSPVRWDAFALWQHTEEEVGRKFTQRIEALTPDGEKFLEAKVVFGAVNNEDLQSKNTFQLFGIPINQEGKIRVITWLGDDENPVGEYYFSMKHLPKEKNEQSPIISAAE
jgi:hypothetical protein